MRTQRESLNLTRPDADNIFNTHKHQCGISLTPGPEPGGVAVLIVLRDMPIFVCVCVVFGWCPRPAYDLYANSSHYVIDSTCRRASLTGKLKRFPSGNDDDIYIHIYSRCASLGRPDPIGRLPLSCSSRSASVRPGPGGCKTIRFGEVLQMIARAPRMRRYY